MGSLIDTSQQTTLKLSNPISTGPLLLDTSADFGFWTLKKKYKSGMSPFEKLKF
jgi:hypothetical protein